MYCKNFKIILIFSSWLVKLYATDYTHPPCTKMWDNLFVLYNFNSGPSIIIIPFKFESILTNILKLYIIFGLNFQQLICKTICNSITTEYEIASQLIKEKYYTTRISIHLLFKILQKHTHIMRSLKSREKAIMQDSCSNRKFLKNAFVQNSKPDWEVRDNKKLCKLCSSFLSTILKKKKKKLKDPITLLQVINSVDHTEGHFRQMS